MNCVEEFVEVGGYPTCDFNFIGMWSWWSMGDRAQISNLRENLVFKLWDYERAQYFCTFVGKTDLYRSVSSLLEYINKAGISPKLQLVPYQVIEGWERKGKIEIWPDQDRRDYVFSLDLIAKLAGGKFERIRGLVNQFSKTYPKAQVKTLDLNDGSVRKQMLDLFWCWADEKGPFSGDVKYELEAIRRHLTFAKLGKLIGIGVYIEGKLVAFSTSSLAFGDYAQAHFRKADVSFKGAYQFLEQNTAKVLVEKGKKHLNYEFDMGIPGLRKAKLSWNPVRLLEKYFVGYA